MKKYNFITLLLFVSLLFACSNNKQMNKEDTIVKEYAYFKDFTYYFDQTFHTSLREIAPKYVFVVPISSCTPCVDKTIEELDKMNPNNSVLVMVGTTDEEERNIKIEKLVSKYKSYRDLASELYTYETNMGKPTLLIIDNQSIESVTLDSDIWEKDYSFLKALKK